VASVRYVVIETADDDVVTPYANAFLPAAANELPALVPDRPPITGNV
jgi:hypothetical protein